MKKAAWIAVLCFLAWSPLPGEPFHSWTVPSPDQAETFSYGDEQHRQFGERGLGRHLAVYLTFTNDPYVSRDEPRLTDNFIFNFPDVTLGPDGRTFLYRAPDGRSVPVAVKRGGFLGIGEVRLTSSSELVVDKGRHGVLHVALRVTDRPLERPDSE